MIRSVLNASNFHFEEAGQSEAGIYSEHRSNA